MESTTTSEEAPSETWPAEVESWLVEVQEEAHLIEALPYVKGTVSFFYSEESTNLNKVHVTVWCCWSAGRLKRVPVHCDEVQRFTHSCCLMSSLRWAPGSQKNASSSQSSAQTVVPPRVSQKRPEAGRVVGWGGCWLQHIFPVGQGVISST